MSRTSAVFVGDGSLLVRCAQAWRDAGHAIACIASHSGEIQAWAGAEGLAFEDTRGGPPQFEGIEFDYLFSVANLGVLPSALLARAAKLAINFHDGPLPQYAGRNVPAWALASGEATHAVTWHEMTEAVDAGRIAAQQSFAIEAEDTTLTLNTRCYEAGLAAFTELVAHIGRGTLALQPQQGERRWFGRDRRPAALGTLDFTRPAAEILRLVRALDFGSYANALARAKVFTGSEVLLVRQARLLPTRSGAAAGTVLAQSADRLHVAAADADLALAGLTRADGSACIDLPAPGSNLCIPAALRARLEEATAAVGRGERHWSEALAHIAPVELPYPRQRGDVPGHVRGDVHGDARSDSAAPLRAALGCTAGPSTIAGCMAWLAALTGQESVSAMFGSSALDAHGRGLEPWLEPWVPLTLRIEPQSVPASIHAAAESAVREAEQAGPLPRDLVTRLGERKPPLAAVRRIGVRLDASTAGTLPQGMELLLTAEAGGGLVLLADPACLAPDTLAQMASQLAHWLRRFDGGTQPVSEISLLTQEDAQCLDRLDASAREVQGPRTIHAAIAEQALRTPDAIALECGDEALSYRELMDRSTRIAAALQQRGVAPGQVIGLALDRRPDLIVAMIAVLQCGAAYLPLDPEYPCERIGYMARDSRTPLVVTHSSLAAHLQLDAAHTWCIDREAGGAASLQPVDVPDSAPAYVIYTSGSTGKPKGVVVTHANVTNFFAGMDERIDREPPGRWLAVTSLSFDISVLELCWTLARGFTVVLHSHTVRAKQAAPEFSLFYFASDHASRAEDRYRLLMEGAKFADEQGFAAVWTPERHFHAFGGLYPNPAVTSAAIAACTKRVQIRAGSCVLPLHHPVRVAEEWAFVDNISQGRVGISFASGWQPNDFVLAPQRFAARKQEMLDGIDVVRRLWRGESLPFPGPDGKPVQVRTLPRPVQKELPVWVTAAGNPETFAQAGELGCHLLTHLLGQTVEDVADKLRAYRMAWARAGHPGQGHVTLMLHTFVGDDDDQVREIVRQPMKDYLRSSVDLIRQAAWSFPTFVQRAAQDGRSPVEIMESAPLSADELDALLEHAFARYYGTSALFGTPQRCLAMVEKLQAAGVDEIACLVDFGIDTQRVLDHLHHLKALMDAARARQPAMQRVSVAEEIARRHVTHLQCTPSMASMLVADAAGRESLQGLRAMMVGGEALPPKLASDLRALVPGQLLNMYGPTETTIWSTTCELDAAGAAGAPVPLGRPIANTQLRIATRWGAQCPALVPGELLIGGAGVAQGYWERPELTAERFTTVDGQRYYRTGDLVRRHPDNTLEFLGRMDHQVKIRGHRIELGEIEAALASQPGVRDAVVIAREDATGEKRLLAYVTPGLGVRLDPAALREALANSLPEVMVPQTVTPMQAFPMTPNGKVDRKALPEPQAIPVRPAGTSPASELEKTIAGIWQDVLGLPQVGTADNFFDLGGHSLLVVQVQRRLRETCGREVSITDMFRLPTIQALASHLGGQAAGNKAVDDGLARAQARRMMRSRVAGSPATPLS